MFHTLTSVTPLFSYFQKRIRQLYAVFDFQFQQLRLLTFLLTVHFTLFMGSSQLKAHRCEMVRGLNFYACRHFLVKEYFRFLIYIYVHVT